MASKCSFSLFNEMFESKVTGNQTAALLAPVIMSERHSQEIFYAELIITPENPLSIVFRDVFGQCLNERRNHVLHQ